MHPATLCILELTTRMLQQLAVRVFAWRAKLPSNMGFLSWMLSICLLAVELVGFSTVLNYNRATVADYYRRACLVSTEFCLSCQATSLILL